MAKIQNILPEKNPFFQKTRNMFQIFQSVLIGGYCRVTFMSLKKGRVLLKIPFKFGVILVILTF